MSEAVRHPRSGDWERALHGYLAECERKPFAWGEHDCLLFSAGAERAMTGFDPAAEIRGKYRSQAGAGRLLKAKGFASLEAAIDAHKPEVPTGHAQRGDWALHEGRVGIIAGRVALFVADVVAGDGEDAPVVYSGLVPVPRAAWEKAWAVGRPVEAEA